MNQENYISNISDSDHFLKVVLSKKFPFLQRKNVKPFFSSELRTQRSSRMQINSLFSFINENFLQKCLKKYNLELQKIELVNSLGVESSSLIVEIKPPLGSFDDDLRFALYKQKELSNVSDSAFMAFKNAGANFPSLRFLKECRFCLNCEFKFKTNAKGKKLI